ncbi:MAG: peptidylprolyl isomerase [Flavobacteriales bacterium]|nr:peptidylprolyl isomerase [Flavobacteriales bacterium]
MKKSLFVLSLIVTCGAFAQNGATDPVLMSVDGQPVLRSEFEAIYKKNNKDVTVTPEALNEYVELFINYKLKVREAEVLRMDTVSKFQQELDGYRKQLARPYLIDRELNEQLMREAYDRSLEEIRASHILVQVAQDAAPEDTLKAWQRINSLRQRVMKGEDFAAVAMSKGGSDDPGVQKGGGDLGYFTALQMVYPFESMAYNTPVGQVSPVVRTRFGYHILKVTDRRPARGTIKVAHVMLRSVDTDSPEKKEATERKIREIHQQLVSGQLSFSDAALKFSEDEGTSSKSGELPEFSTGKMIEEFEDAAFALTTDGAISDPVRTRYGWHIIKRMSYVAPAGFEQAKSELKNKIARDSRADITKRAFLDKLRKDYNYQPNDKNVKALYALVDSTIFKKGTVVSDTLVRKNVKEGVVVRKGMKYRREINGVMENGKVVNIRSRRFEDLVATPNDTVVVRDIQEGWSYDRAKAKSLNKPVFTITGRSFSQTEFLDYLEAKQKRERTVPIKGYVDGRFQEFVDDMLMAEEDANLETKYPEFRMLMKEYRDGILLFELTDQKVWSRAVKDTVGLREFYEANKGNYMTPSRVDADVYTCATAAVAKGVRKLHKKGKRANDLLTEANKASALNLNIEYGPFDQASRPYFAGLSQPGLSKDIPVDGRVVIVDMRQLIAPRPKTLDEARGAVTAAYQDSLEKAWLEELRAKYPVTVDRQVLMSIR